jgi:hypothetical protein
MTLKTAGTDGVTKLKGPTSIQKMKGPINVDSNVYECLAIVLKDRLSDTEYFLCAKDEAAIRTVCRVYWLQEPNMTMAQKVVIGPHAKARPVEVAKAPTKPKRKAKKGKR